MAVVVHPLTVGQDGNPKYSAANYRHSVNPFLATGNGSAFECLPGVRSGSPSPLCSINGLNVTVHAHAGIMSPWVNQGSYTYYVDADTVVKIASTTGSFKIAVIVDDPSTSHGSTPQGTIQSIAGSTPNTSINGLVIATVTDGKISDTAVRLQPSTTVVVSSATQLDSYSAPDGTYAQLANSTTKYLRENGKWIIQTHDLPSLLTHGQWYGDYTYQMSGGITGRSCLLYLRLTRTAADWSAAAWASAVILKVPADLVPKVPDMNVLGIGNTKNQGFGFGLGSAGDLSVRCFKDDIFGKNSWLEGTLVWQF